MPYGRIDPADTVALMRYWYTYRGPIYAGLVFGDPYLTNDPLSVEIIGGAYYRPVLALSLVDSQLRNSGPLAWALPAMTTLAGVTGWDAPFNGGLRFYTPFDEPIDYPVGGTFTLDALELYVGLDS